MRRARFVLSPQALEDLDKIWLFLATDSVDLADRVEGEIRDAIRQLVGLNSATAVAI